jgi:hypothetical protein
MAQANAPNPVPQGKCFNSKRGNGQWRIDRMMVGCLPEK